MPAWLTDLIANSPVVAGIAAAGFFLHRIVRELLAAPLSLAALLGVLGGRDRRRDARAMARILRGHPDGDPSSAVEPTQPRRWRRRKRRRRR